MADNLSVKSGLTTKMDRLLTMITIVAAVVFCGAMIRHSAATFGGGGGGGQIPVGTKVELPGINWDEKEGTLVLFLQAGCRYCEASMPFYRDLLAANQSKGFKAVLAFPQSGAAGRAYLASHHLDISDIRQTEFRGLGVEGTPTMLLVGRDGRVLASWVGKLSAKEERSVFDRLHLTRVTRSASNDSSEVVVGGVSAVAAPPDGSGVPAAASRPEVGSLTQKEFLRLYKSAPVIDSRPRELFRKGHVAGAVNIPTDEAEARARHEVPVEEDAVLFCHQSNSCAVSSRNPGEDSQCSTAYEEMKALGFSRMKVANLDLAALSAAGIEVVKGVR